MVNAEDVAPEEIIEERPTKEGVTNPPLPIVAKPPPIPQILKNVKDNAAYKNFLDILKQVQINIPLVDIF